MNNNNLIYNLKRIAAFEFAIREQENILNLFVDYMDNAAPCEPAFTEKHPIQPTSKVGLGVLGCIIVLPILLFCICDLVENGLSSSSVILTIIGAFLPLFFVFLSIMAKQDFNEQNEKYKQQMKIYNKKLDNYNSSYQSNYENWKKNLQKFKQETKEIKDSLEKRIYDLKSEVRVLYIQNDIPTKYRNSNAIYAFIEYIQNKRCSALEGPYGAYNLYEFELKQNMAPKKKNIKMYGKFTGNTIEEFENEITELKNGSWDQIYLFASYL